MKYLEITKIVLLVIGAIMAIFPIEYFLICLAGMFSKGKKFPVREEKLRYGVVICARNEEKVIGQLVESIRKCNYPQDKIDIFVIAHNCTDRTAEIARQNMSGGGQVYEYNNSNEKTKGYALKKIFQYIERDYGIQTYDGFHVFDADNILDEEYFNKMNDAFLYYDKKNAITSFRNAKNFGENAQTACYGYLYIMGCTIESNGRMALNGCARILGSGFLISAQMVKDGWNIVNLSDDTDFSIEQLLEGNKVKYCHEAMYYDEHPTKFKDMWRQRLRWAKGTVIVCNKRFGSLFKTAFGLKKRKEDEPKRCRWSSIDMMCTILPVGAIGLFTSLIDITLKAFVPLFGVNPAGVWIRWAIWAAVGLGGGYLVMVLLAVACLIKERKRLPKSSAKVRFASVLYWPIYSTMIIFLQIIALFSRKQFAWTQIEHKNQANFDTFNTGVRQSAVDAQSVSQEDDMVTVAVTKEN